MPAYGSLPQVKDLEPSVSPNQELQTPRLWEPVRPRGPREGDWFIAGVSVPGPQPLCVCVGGLASWGSLLLLCLPALPTWCPELNTQAWALSSQLDLTDVDVTTSAATTLTCTPCVQGGLGGFFGDGLRGPGAPLPSENFWGGVSSVLGFPWPLFYSFVDCPSGVSLSQSSQQGFCCWEREGTTRDWLWKRERRTERDRGAEAPCTDPSVQLWNVLSQDLEGSLRSEKGAEMQLGSQHRPGWAPLLSSSSGTLRVAHAQGSFLGGRKASLLGAASGAGLAAVPPGTLSE